MKNIFKKNQIIITALAIMIAIAGYLNFTMNKDDKTADTGGDVLDYDTISETSGDDILDGSTVSPEGTNTSDAEDGLDITTESGKLTADNDTEDNDEFADISDEDLVVDDTMDGEDADEVAQYDVTDTGEVVVDDTKADDEETGTPGEAILVSTTTSPNFYASAKLTREQTRARNRETLMDLVNNENISEEEKEVAIASVLEMTKIAETENATETLLEAKGFSDVVVSITDESIDVIVNAEIVTEQEIAQIEDIVKRKTGAESKDIVIAPAVMNE